MEKALEMGSLKENEINPLSVASFAVIFSHSPL